MARSMARWLAPVFALVLVAAACNGDDNDAAQPPPTNDGTPPNGANGSPPPNGEPAWASCTNPVDGWTVEYPVDWHVNDAIGGGGGPGTAPSVPECSLFDPEPVTVPEPPGEIPSDIAVQLRVDEIVTDFDDFLVDPFAEVLDEQQVTVDGRDGYRQERRHTGEGFYPEGMTTVRYTVDLGDRAFLGMSHDVGEPAFATRVDVLDEMMQRLRFEVDPGDPADPVDPAEGAWVELAQAPIEPRLNHSATWTDGRLIVWGGGDAEGVEADGAAFETATDLWRVLPPAPIEARWGHSAFWTGDRLLVWGGSAGPDHLAECFTDGALYDPVTGTWEPVPSAPGAERRCGASAVWSGSELLVFGGFDDVGPPTPGTALDDGAAFDPATGEWRAIPSAPVEARSGATAAWTGQELVVVGGTGDPGEPGEAGEVGQPLADGAAYDPVGDQWRTIAPFPLEPRTGPLSAWTGGELVVFGGQDVFDPAGGETREFRDGAAYDPAADTWRPVADLPAAARSGAVAEAGDGFVFVVGGSGPEGTDTAGGHALVWDAATDTWTELPDPPGTPRTNHTATWSGDELLVWGGQVRNGEPGAAVPFVAWRLTPADPGAVDIYFTPEAALAVDCSAVEPVSRSVAGPADLQAALSALLAGPRPEDQEAGLTSWFSDQTAGDLRSVDVADGVARVDFADFSGTIPNASTACGSAILLAQLDATVTQFDGVESAIYSFDGDVDAFYHWLQLDPPNL